MISLDTNILARFYVDDPGDPEAAEQRPIAYDVIAKSPSLFVPLTVILELEWVLRAFYRFDVKRVTKVMEHLLGLANINVEEAVRVSRALTLLGEGAYPRGQTRIRASSSAAGAPLLSRKLMHLGQGEYVFSLVVMLPPCGEPRSG